MIVPWLRHANMYTQVVYRMLLDLHAISNSLASHRPAVLAAFLQRRRAPRLHVQPCDADTTTALHPSHHPDAAHLQPSNRAVWCPHVTALYHRSSRQGQWRCGG
jgi:hypothetical protein